MNSPSERLNFIDLVENKPSLVKIQRYLDTRLHSTEHQGVEVSHDFLGNTVITSLEQEEQTLAGTVPATFIASPEGRHIVVNNPGILSQIYHGTIPHISHTWHGLESKVYQIVLRTDAGQKEYALKYTFPINEIHKIYTSGIVAMRMMQLAEKERPIPFIHYTVPVFATHDITVAPFVFNGISTINLLWCFDSPDNDWHLSNLLHDVLAPKHKQLIRKMREREAVAIQNNQPTFTNHVHEVLHKQDKVLVGWVHKQCRHYSEFTHHRYRTNDTTLRQSVINIEELYRLNTAYYENPTFNSFSPEFISALLNTLSVVELGGGRV
jgi:hypothetical protein